MAETSAPQQNRSRRTLERTLRATEELLKRQSFEEITVADIVRKAKSSVGSFYARCGSKEGLLPLLYERYDRDLHRRMSRWLDETDWAQAPLADRARWCVELFVSTYRERRWLMRAVGLFARARPSAISPELLERRGRLQRRLVDVIAARAEEIRHPDPARAIELGLFFVAAACREKMLFDAPHARLTKVSDKELKKELTRALLAYLTTPDSSGAARRSQK